MVEAGNASSCPTFGKGNRLIQGDCGERCRRGEYKRGIEGGGEVLDYHNVLNQEQFWSARSIAKKCLSTK